MRTFSTKSGLETKNKNTNIKSPSAMLWERNPVHCFELQLYPVIKFAIKRQQDNIARFIRFAMKSHKKIMNKNNVLY